MLTGGFMLIRLPGNYASSNYALYETNTRQWVIRKISDPWYTNHNYYNYIINHNLVKKKKWKK